MSTCQLQGYGFGINANDAYQMEDDDLGLELESSSKGNTRKFEGGTFSSPKRNDGGSEGWINPSSAKQSEELKLTDPAYEPENAMEAKLRKMQLDLRVQLNSNEDRQGYDS